MKTVIKLIAVLLLAFSPLVLFASCGYPIEKYRGVILDKRTTLPFGERILVINSDDGRKSITGTWMFGNYGDLFVGDSVIVMTNGNVKLIEQ